MTGFSHRVHHRCNSRWCSNYVLLTNLSFLFPSQGGSICGSLSQGFKSAGSSALRQVFSGCEWYALHIFRKACKTIIWKGLMLILLPCCGCFIWIDMFYRSGAMCFMVCVFINLHAGVCHVYQLGTTSRVKINILNKHCLTFLAYDLISMSNSVSHRFKVISEAVFKCCFNYLKG